MMTKTTQKFLLVTALFMISSNAFATTTPPPAYAGFLADVWYFYKTQGLEWCMGAAAAGLGISKMFSADNETVKKVGNFGLGAGIAFGFPAAVMRAFGTSGFNVSQLFGG